MATHSTYTDGTNIASLGGHPNISRPVRTVISNVFDASKRACAAADVVKVLDIPANCFVEKVFYHVLTADASQTMSIGDGDDTDGWVAAADVGTLDNRGSSALAATVDTSDAGAAADPATFTGYTAGKLYTAADTIDLLVPATKAWDTLKVRISAAVTLLQ